MKLTQAAYQDCLTISFAEDATQNERDAAAMAVQAFKANLSVPPHVQSELAQYVFKPRIQQDRYGK
jgi:hypothetical protein